MTKMKNEITLPVTLVIDTERYYDMFTMSSIREKLMAIGQKRNDRNHWRYQYVRHPEFPTTARLEILDADGKPLSSDQIWQELQSE